MADDFETRVREVVAALGPGQVMSYGEVAVEAGHPGAARAVGNLHGRSKGYNESQMPHPDQEGHLEACAHSWRNATAPRKRAAPNSGLLSQLQIYLVKKGK